MNIIDIRIRIYSMKNFAKTIAFTLLSLLSLSSFAQNIRDFKVKNDINASERTSMLDLIRSDLYQMFNIEMKFLVEHFKVSEEYAWFEGTAQRKDGKPLILPDDSRDCCKVYCLFIKTDNSWSIERLLPFCTDVCYWGIGNQVTAPYGIFPKNGPYFIE